MIGSHQASSDPIAEVGAPPAASLRSQTDEIARELYEHAMHRFPDSMSDLGPAYQAGLRAAVTNLVEFWLDWIATMTVTIDRESNVAARSGSSSLEQHRAAVAHKLLAHEPVTAHELESLGYEITDGWHVCVMVGGPESDQALERLRHSFTAELMPLPAPKGPTRAWLKTRDRALIDTFHEHLAGLSRVRVSVGESRHGLEGLRATDAEALTAWPIAQHAPTLVTRCADVTLAAAVQTNPTLLRLHSERYLAPLDTLRFGGDAARATLTAYVQCNGNIASASAKAGMARRTMEYRLGAIGMALKCEVSQCVPELAVALQLHAATVPAAASAVLAAK